MYTSSTAAIGALVLSTLAQAHIAAWHPAMFGFDAPKQSAFPYNGSMSESNYISHLANTPLRGNDHHTEKEWLGNALKDFPPAHGVFLNVPSGSDVQLEMSTGRHNTRWTAPHLRDKVASEIKFASTEVGPLHTANRFDKPLNVSLLGGTSLAIAYTPDVNSVRGEDFTVISVNWASPWFRSAKYPIPNGMPPCPEGGCLCTWNWIHTVGNKGPDGNSEGYGSEMYNILFRCMVTGNTDAGNIVPRGAVPTSCENDFKNCTSGPKQPMYLWQADGNNMELAPHEANPTYNWRYGFKDGAQGDAVVPKDKVSFANVLGVDGEGLDPATADLSQPEDVDLSASLFVSLGDGNSANFMALADVNDKDFVSSNTSFSAVAFSDSSSTPSATSSGSVSPSATNDPGTQEHTSTGSQGGILVASPTMDPSAEVSTATKPIDYIQGENKPIPDSTGSHSESSLAADPTAPEGESVIHPFGFSPQTSTTTSGAPGPATSKCNCPKRRSRRARRHP